MSSTDPDGKYEDSEELQQLCREVLFTGHPALEDAKRFPFRIMFTTQKTMDYAGQCSLVPAAIRWKAGFAFVIKIKKDDWETSDDEKKLLVVIHELHHIGSRSGRPKIREHNEAEGFCEFPSHDEFSRKVRADIKDKLPKEMQGADAKAQAVTA
jgi:hypothetical protein